MKVTVKLDCTPEEFRRFMGLPDVSPLHEQMQEKMQEAMSQAMPTMDPEELMKAWMPQNLGLGEDALTEFQKTMWDAMTMGTKSKK